MRQTGLRRNFGPWSPWARFERARTELDEFLYEEIPLRRKERDLAERDDVLSLLLRATDVDGRSLSDHELGDELVTVIAASFAQFEIRAILERAELRAAKPRAERPRLRNITTAPARGCRVVLEHPLRPLREDQVAAVVAS